MHFSLIQYNSYWLWAPVMTLVYNEKLVLNRKQVVENINRLPCKVITEMESGYFLPPLGCYWGCIKRRCSLWFIRIAVSFSSSIREHFISTQVIVMSCASKAQRTHEWKLLRRFPCKQGRRTALWWEGNRSTSVWFAIPCLMCKCHCNQGLIGLKGQDLNTVVTGDIQTHCLSHQIRHTLTNALKCTHKSPHAWIQLVTSCSMFTSCREEKLFADEEV